MGTISFMIFLALYSIIYVLSVAMFTFWLHEVRRKELGGSWVAAFLLAAFISVVWPVSTFMLYLAERNKNTPIDDFLDNFLDDDDDFVEKTKK